MGDMGAEGAHLATSDEDAQSRQLPRLDVADAESGRAYIHALLDVTAADARNNAVIAAAEVATILYVIKDSIDRIRDAGELIQGVAAGTVASLGLSAACFFAYSAMVNQQRMNIARYLAENDANKARDLWVSTSNGIKERYGSLRQIGFLGLILGAIGVSFVVIGLLLTDPILTT